MDAGSQPLGTGTTFFNMMDFAKPKTQQAPAPTPAAPSPAAPTAPVPAAPSVMSYADWRKQNPFGIGVGDGYRQRGRQADDAPGYMQRLQNNQNQYMMEMIRQLGGLPEGANGAPRQGGRGGRGW